LSAIARKTGYSRNTVKRWLRQPEGIEPKYRRVRRDGKLAPYAAYRTALAALVIRRVRQNGRA
jgi:transposase